MFKPLLRVKILVLCGVFVSLGLLVFQLQSAPTTGGDIPVTTERLTGSLLKFISGDLTWTFKGTTVVIANDPLPLPPDLIEELLGSQAGVRRIEATWSLDEKTNKLQLTKTKVDGEPFADNPSISIHPAGQVRVNLGSRQYNLFRNITK